MVRAGRADLRAGGIVAAAGRPAAGSEGDAAMRIRGMDAEGLRLGIPKVHCGPGERVWGGASGAIREPASARKDRGFLRTAETELRREVLSAGSAGVVPEYGRRPGVLGIRPQHAHTGIDGQAVRAVVVDVGFQRGSDEFVDRTAGARGSGGIGGNRDPARDDAAGVRRIPEAVREARCRGIGLRRRVGAPGADYRSLQVRIVVAGMADEFPSAFRNAAGDRVEQSLVECSSDYNAEGAVGGREPFPDYGLAKRCREAIDRK